MFRALFKLSLHYVIGLKIQYQFVNQWEAKPKPTAPCIRDFARALSTSNSHWFIALFAPVVIGWNNYVDIGFSTVIWKWYEPNRFCRAYPLDCDLCRPTLTYEGVDKNIASIDYHVVPAVPITPLFNDPLDDIHPTEESLLSVGKALVFELLRLSSLSCSSFSVL